MGAPDAQVSLQIIMEVAASQRGRITYDQLRALGLSKGAIKHRVASGRLRRHGHKVFGLGVIDDSREAGWMTGVLLGGTGTLLSHSFGFALWGLGQPVGRNIEISVPLPRSVRRPGLTVHRRGSFLGSESRVRNQIPVTSPALTIIDNARRVGLDGVDRAISEADARGHVAPEVVHLTARRLAFVPGAKIVSGLLDRRTLVLTETELERWFAKIIRRAGLPIPLTQEVVNGYRVDFYWPELGLVVETDGGSYHRTPGQQTRDRREDQTHLLAGMTPLRFTHEQVRYAPDEVESVLAPIVQRLQASSSRTTAL